MGNEASEEVGDNLNFASNKEITRNLSKMEKIILSIKVWKVNRFNSKQQRSLLLTNFQLYNLCYNKFQREIRLKDIVGVTKSKDSSSKEFVIHVNN